MTGINGALAGAAAGLAAAWGAVAVYCLGRRRWGLASAAAALAVALAVAAVWAPAVPLALAGWLLVGLAQPAGRLTLPRRFIAAIGLAAAGAWTTGLASSDAHPTWPAFTGSALVVIVVWVVTCRPASSVAAENIWRPEYWIAAGALTVAAVEVTFGAAHVIAATPADLAPFAVAALAPLPVAVALSQARLPARTAERALVAAGCLAGFAMLIPAGYIAGLAATTGSLDSLGAEANLSGMVGSLIVATLALPVHRRLSDFVRTSLGHPSLTPEAALATFGAGMTREVPLDDLLLQLAELLHGAIGPSGAEVWLDSNGTYRTAASVPEQEPRRLVLDEQAQAVAARTRIGGASWVAMWAPGLLGEPVPVGNARSPAGPEVETDHDGRLVRVAPATHGGDLLGLLVVRRSGEDAPFNARDDAALVELARHVALALYNVRLDTALQASLEELSLRNAELQASRLRIVAAADASRRAIERDIHDGAQQHLVAISIKLGLAQQQLQTDPTVSAAVLDDLRTDVQAAITALRELAHGIYSPLLRQHGLAQALSSAARRSALPVSIEVDLPSRYCEQIEAAVYFCCLEAIQNANKHAGAAAHVSVVVTQADGRLIFTVADDGAGFDPSTASGRGGGFVNMGDRLGAIGGTLSVHASLGSGTTVRGTIPIAPASADATR